MLAARLIAALVAVGVAIVGAAALAGHLAGVPMGVLFRDATAAAGILRGDGPSTYAGSFYLGAVSTLTIAVWSAVTVLNLFVAWLWRERDAALMAALTALMGADDALLLHEKAGPALGIPDLAWPALYGAVSAVLLWRLLRVRALGAAAALVVGLVLLAESLGIDVLDEMVLHMTAGWLIVAEDGSKLMGAMVWLAVPVLLHVRRAAQLEAAREAGPVAAITPPTRPSPPDAPVSPPPRGRAGAAAAPARPGRSTRG